MMIVIHVNYNNIVGVSDRKHRDTTKVLSMGSTHILSPLSHTKEGR